jgi:hypothetical protein
VLEKWFAERSATATAPGGLAALRPRSWPQEWNSELLELITVLTLLAQLRPEQQELAEKLDSAEGIGRAALSRLGMLPPSAAARRPASVLDLPEEGPEGQLALL